MKKWISFILMFSLSSSLLANNMPFPAETESEIPTDIITPTWAVDPIGRPRSTKIPSSEMLRNKRAAAVIIGTMTTIIIGLLVSGHNTGKPVESPNK